MENKLIYVDLVKHDKREYSDRNTYIFESTPSNYNNITEMTNRVYDRLKELNLTEGDCLKLYVKDKEHTVLLVCIINVCLMHGINIILEVITSSKSYSLPVINTSQKSVDKYVKRYNVYVENTKLKDAL